VCGVSPFNYVQVSKACAAPLGFYLCNARLQNGGARVGLKFVSGSRPLKQRKLSACGPAREKCRTKATFMVYGNAVNKQARSGDVIREIPV